MFARHSGRRSSAPILVKAVAMAISSALELLIPDALGRSLATAMSAPSGDPGKLRESRC